MALVKAKLRILALFIRVIAKEEININDASKIVEITSKTYTKLPYDDGTKKMKYVVTALDRMSNESKISKKKVKL